MAGAMREELYDEIELPDGETAYIPEDDAVQPTFGNFHADVTVTVQQDRLKMSESGSCLASVAAPTRSIDAEREPFGSIFAPISHGTDVDDVYAEVAFRNIEQVRKLRDTLDLILRYRGDSE